MSFFCAFFWSVVCLFLVSNFPLTGASPDFRQLKGSESFQRGHLAETPGGETIASCEAKETINAAATALQKAQQKITEVKKAKTDADGEYEKVKNVKSEASQNIADAKSKWENAKNGLGKDKFPASVSRVIDSSEEALKQAESKVAEISSHAQIAEGNLTKSGSEIEKAETKLNEANEKFKVAKGKCTSAVSETDKKTEHNTAATVDANEANELFEEALKWATDASESLERASSSISKVRITKYTVGSHVRTLNGNADALPGIYANGVAKDKATERINSTFTSAKESQKRFETSGEAIKSTFKKIEGVVNEINALKPLCSVQEMQTQKEEAQKQLSLVQSALAQAEKDTTAVTNAIKNITKVFSEISASFFFGNPEELTQKATTTAEEITHAEQRATSQVNEASAALNAAQGALTNAKKIQSTATEITCKASQGETQTVNPSTKLVNTQTVPSRQEDVSKKQTESDKETVRKAVKKNNISRDDSKLTIGHKENANTDIQFTNGAMHFAFTYFTLLFTLVCVTFIML